MMSASYIDFSTMSGFVLESVLTSISECLKVAGKYDGRCFGGYVRNVIVPRDSNPTCPVKFKDVDIWFTNQNSADSFVREMGSSLIQMDKFAIEKNDVGYKFGRKQYHLFKYGTCVAWIDVIVSDKIPVNDFNVNRLTALYRDGELVFESFGEESTSTLIGSIVCKQAVILPEYVKILTFPSSPSPSHPSSIHFNRLNRIYLSNGWSISCLTEIPDSPDIKWLRRHVSYIPPAVNPIPTPVHPIPAPVHPTPAPVHPTSAVVNPVSAPVHPKSAPVHSIPVPVPVNPVPAVNSSHEYCCDARCTRIARSKVQGTVPVYCCDAQCVLIPPDKPMENHCSKESKPSVSNYPVPQMESKASSVCANTSQMENKSILVSVNDSKNTVPPTQDKIIKSIDTNREEALAAFTMGIEAMKIAFLKVLDQK